MLKRVLLSGLYIFVAWAFLDLLLHRLALSHLYEQYTGQLRPFEQMNITLVYLTSFGMIVAFVGTYQLLVRPKSLGAGLLYGAFIGFALGISVGFGSYIHLPIPLVIAGCWLMGGWLKGLAAGAIVGKLITDF